MSLRVGEEVQEVPRGVSVAAPSLRTQEALWRLMKAIVRDDASEVTKLLASAPSLATERVIVGATRQATKDYFFREIVHYLYGGDTPLHAAAAGYRKAIAQQLLKNGANVTAVNRRGATPLHYAADGHASSRGWNPAAQAEMIALLIRAGADANALDKSGVAPLHRSVRQRCASAVDAHATRPSTSADAGTPADSWREKPCCCRQRERRRWEDYRGREPGAGVGEAWT